MLTFSAASCLLIWGRPCWLNLAEIGWLERPSFVGYRGLFAAGIWTYSRNWRPWLFSCGADLLGRLPCGWGGWIEEPRLEAHPFSWVWPELVSKGSLLVVLVVVKLSCWLALRYWTCESNRWELVIVALRQFDRSGISKGLVVCAMRAGFGSEFR